MVLILSAHEELTTADIVLSALRSPTIPGNSADWAKLEAWLKGKPRSPEGEIICCCSARDVVSTIRRIIRARQDS